MAKSVISSNTHASVSIRKIDNGYVVSQSCDGPKGWTSKETFFAKKPVLDLPAVSPAPKAKPKPAAKMFTPKR